MGVHGKGFRLGSEGHKDGAVVQGFSEDDVAVVELVRQVFAEIVRLAAELLEREKHGFAVDGHAGEGGKCVAILLFAVALAEKLMQNAMKVEDHHRALDEARTRMRAVGLGGNEIQKGLPAIIMRP